MAKRRTGTYYQFEPLSGAFPTIYYKYLLGESYRLDRDKRRGVHIDPDYLTRYLQTGEAGFDRTTRKAIEDAAGFPLPD